MSPLEMHSNSKEGTEEERRVVLRPISVRPLVVYACVALTQSQSLRLNASA